MAGLILITSGKGGVGKTTLCAHLGAALSRRGRRVLLVETDAGFRTLDILFSLEETIVFDLADVLEGRCTIQQAMIAHKETGLTLIPSPVDAGYRPALGAVEDFCRWASRNYDEVIFDSAAGFGATQEMLARYCNMAVVVTQPEPAAARGSARVSGLLRSVGLEHQRLIINRVPLQLPLGTPIRDLDDVIDTVGVQLIGAVPEEPGLRRPGAEADDTPAGEELDRIARRLLGEDAELVLFR